MFHQLEVDGLRGVRPPHLLRIVRREDHLVRHNRNGRGLCKDAHALEVRCGHRLLEQRDVQVFRRPGKAECLAPGVPLVPINPQIDPGTDGPANRA